MNEPFDNPQGAAAPKFATDLDTLIRARYPLLYLVSWEEQRMEALLQDLAAQHGKMLYTWSLTRGLRRMGARTVPLADATRSPLEALAAIAKLNEPALVILKDFHACFQEAAVIRAVRELCQDLKSTFTTVIILAPTLTIPVELEKEVSVLDVPLPTYRDLYQLLREIVSVVREGNKATIDLSRETADQLIKAALGLTLSEAENAFAKAIANDGRLDASDIKLVLEEKRQVIRKSGLLEYFPADENLAGIGGLDDLKTWLLRRASGFGEPARKFGLPWPKGLLLLGVQGCGKSLTARAVAAQWNLPLLRLDMGRIFSSFIGSSEENLRKAIRVAESVAPAVLWVDEIDKGLSGAGSSSASDGGVSARVFGSLLTWLQEKTSPVFVVATANRVDLLPPELLRKGRFDEIFFIDLPASSERREIFRIHLARRGRNPALFDLDQLAAATEGFSGAEIEQAIVSALVDAFHDGRELEGQHLIRACGESFPLSITMGEEIARLREWAKTRTRLASAKPGSVAGVARG